MEGIIGFILVILVIVIVRFLITVVIQTGHAGLRALMGKGTFSDNMETTFKGIGNLKLRINKTYIDKNNSSSSVAIEIEGKGAIPIEIKTRIGFVTSVFDYTNGQLDPVVSALDVFQEKNSIIFQHKMEVGEISPEQYFPNWVRLGVVIPDIIQPPYSGTRNLLAILRMIDLNNSPIILNGFHVEVENKLEPGLLWQDKINFDWAFTEKGYIEAAEDRDESLAIAIKMSVAVAMVDGTFDNRELKILKDQVNRAIQPFPKEKQRSLKALYNQAANDAYKDAKSGDLSLSKLVNRLNEIGERNSKYKAIELCLNIMAADGVADKKEIRLIRKLAEALELDLDELKKMQDQKIIELNASATDHASIEVILGIDEYWSKDKIQRYLRTEFQKWNNRINTLEEGEERENAQRMLNLIAQARKKYG